LITPTTGGTTGSGPESKPGGPCESSGTCGVSATLLTTVTITIKRP